MNPDDHVCLCFHVSQRKIVNFLKRERPVRVSLLSECLSAGTGCGWCIPFLTSLYEQVMRDDPHPDLPVSPEEYATRRARYRATGDRGTSDTGGSG
ncbi:MAG: (2Fe-2S)-binding protein [Planctomycetes bacterium]|nr:(2Fe-2S)-binding protein [Planctomycetota bacterium]